jgi:hypothetical protein
MTVPSDDVRPRFLRWREADADARYTNQILQRCHAPAGVGSRYNSRSDSEPLVLLLLVIPLGLLWFSISAHRERLGFGSLSVRGAFVLAFLAFEVLLLGITELTSVGHHFTAATVAVAWLIVIIVLLFGVRTQIRSVVQRVRSHDGARFGLADRAKRLTGEDRFWIAVLTVIFGLLVAAGFLHPPSYADSMVYHLARVEHWIQNRSVAFFATHYLAQVEFSPLSEYNLAHLHLLSGTDRFDACMELLSALVCIVGVSELARLLGASRSTQIAASVICATIPSGILLATSTDNDYFAAATGLGVLVILASFSLGSRWGYRAIALGAALGLCYMAKSTMVVLMVPAVLALLAVAVFRQVRTEGLEETLRRGISQVLVIAVSALAVGGVFLAQTEQLFGSFRGSETKDLVSSPITIAGLAANIDRSTAADFHIGDGVAGIQTYVSQVVLGVLGHAYSVFGVSMNDPHYASYLHSDTFAPGNFTVPQRIPAVGANPWNILLALSAAIILVVVVARGRREFRMALVLCLSLGCGYLLVTGLSKWAPFNVRYQLPFLVAVSVVIAVALSIFPRWVTRLVLVGLVLSCLPQLFDNVEAPLVPPYQFHGPYLTSYFGLYSNPPGAEQAAAYQTVTTMLSQSTCKQAAIGNWVLFEYPLWVGLQHEHYKGVLNDFDVTNVSRKLEPSYRPCASITQQGPGYVTPNNGTVNVQQSILALSINPRNAATIRTDIPRFQSKVRGVRVFPGGGWSTARFGTLPFLGAKGSLYLFSDSAQPVQLQLHLVSTTSESTVRLSEANGQPVPMTIRHDTIEADLNLRRGITRIDMVTEPNSAAHRPQLALTDVTLRSGR